MQTRIPVSKPLALVIIGLIIGLSLGLGSGYAVFYPDMVNQRSKTVEERIANVEDNVAALDSRISAINDSISDIDESFNGILTLADIVNQISSKVSTLENGQVTLNNKLKSLENELNRIEGDLTAIEDSWNDLTNQFSDLETVYHVVNNELTDIQGLVRENDGVRILTGYMANPPSTFEQKIAAELYNLMISEEPSFKTWSDLYGESTAKLLLQQEIDAIAGNLVWNPTENTPVGDNSYQIKLQTFFTLDFKPASLTVRNIHLEIKATVNINSGAVNSLQVSLVEKM